MSVQYIDHEKCGVVCLLKASAPQLQPPLAHHWTRTHLTVDGKVTLCGKEGADAMLPSRVLDCLRPSDCAKCRARTRPKLSAAAARTMARSYDHSGGDGWLPYQGKGLEDLRAAGLVTMVGSHPKLNYDGLRERVKRRLEAGQDIPDSDDHYLWSQDSDE